MIKQRLDKNKKAISPVIATVVLITLVLVVGIIIFIWAKGFFDENVEKFNEPIKNSCALVSLDLTLTNKDLSVVNTGSKVPIHALNIKLDNGTITRSEDIDLSPSQSTIITNVNENAKVVIPILLGNGESGEQEYVCDDTEIAIP